MNGPRGWIASVVAGLLGVMVVSVLVGPRLLHPTSGSTAPHAAAQSLPASVCTLTPGMLDLAHSTRLEAKLVTFEAAESSDPNFPWRTYPTSPRPASWSRVIPPSPTPPPAYYWVIAEHGTYVWNVNHLPSTNGSSPAGPSTFHDVLVYVSADTCEGRGVSAGVGGWPAWFDGMPAVVDLKFK